MKKVLIKSISEENKYYDQLESVEVYVDGERIGFGSYGGEPEDNSRIRDYGWVEDVIVKLAEKLGAEVKYQIIEIDKDGKETSNERSK